MLPLSSPASTLLLCSEDADWSPAPTSSAHKESVPAVDHYHLPISDLLATELAHWPLPDYHLRLCNHSLDPSSRRNAISWILKVHGFYGFRPVTAYLAVNYMDRFLSTNKLPGNVGWPWQLLSVACLSVAAKMEETQVPLLLDLQVMAPPFVFDPCTVRRMELFLMAALRWRLRAVTPFDFLDHFSAGGGAASASAAVVSRASDIVLNTLDVVDFLKYKPSAISAAAILSAAEEIAAFYPNVDLSSTHELVYNKEIVDDCLRLMETCLGVNGWLKRGTLSEPRLPQSPVGVLDAAACGSCDSQKPERNQAEPSQGEATPPSGKRRRVGSFRCTETIDTVDVDDDG